MTPNSERNAERVAERPLIGLTCRWDEEQKRYYLPSEYAEAVSEAGGVPVLIPLIPGTAADLASRVDGIILTGSASDIDPELYYQKRHPEVKAIHTQRDETDFTVLEQAFAEKKPVLGICFGMQSLNVYLGGSLVQDIPATIPSAVEHNREARHEILIEPGSRIAAWTDGAERIQVNSWHHQSVDKPGLGLRVAAVAPDGVIEALQGNFPDHFVVAVQWHPERIWKNEPLSARLFRELVEAAERRKSEIGTQAGGAS